MTAKKNTKSTPQERMFTASEVLGIQMLTATHILRFSSIANRVRELGTDLSSCGVSSECSERLYHASNVASMLNSDEDENDAKFNAVMIFDVALNILANNPTFVRRVLRTKKTLATRRQTV